MADKYSEHAQPTRQPCGFTSAGDIELAQQVGHMHAHGLGAEEHHLADLAIGEPVGDETEDLQLSVGDS